VISTPPSKSPPYRRRLRAAIVEERYGSQEADDSIRVPQSPKKLMRQASRGDTQWATAVVRP
jgi:hypothetical protein